MAALTHYLTNNSASVGSDLSDTDPGAEAYRSPVTGWIVSTGTTNRSPYANDVEQAAATFVDNTPPDGTLDTINGDFWTSPILNGDFASANWEVHACVRANTNGGAQDGNIYCRLFKGANQDGSGATEITGAAQTSTAYTNLATSATQDCVMTFNPGAFTLTNEYYFVQLACGRTGAGGMTSADVDFRIGNASALGSRVVTADFTPAAVTDSDTPYVGGGYYPAEG